MHVDLYFVRYLYLGIDVVLTSTYISYSIHFTKISVKVVDQKQVPEARFRVLFLVRKWKMLFVEHYAFDRSYNTFMQA